MTLPHNLSVGTKYNYEDQNGGHNTDISDGVTGLSGIKSIK